MICENRRARFDYHVDEDIEVGMVLMGSEVKSLRGGGGSIAEAYAAIENGELWLINGHIPCPLSAKTWGHEERRRRKLLVSKRELARLWKATQREGMTLVPLRLYANERGVMKLRLAIARGKKAQDKREVAARRDWDRSRARLLKGGLAA
jgi:SsrA-binding protein